MKDDALDGLMPLVDKSKHIKTAVVVLEQQVENCDQDNAKLALFGRGFEIGKIKGTDQQVSIYAIVHS